MGVDDHGGSIQYTECETSSMLQCHVMDNVLCELFYGCPLDLANSPKKDWLIDFCKTSQANKEGDKAQIGKSILKFGYNITEVTDWSLKQTKKKCDDGIYDRCANINANFTESCTSESFSSDDLCFSEGIL